MLTVVLFVSFIIVYIPTILSINGRILNQYLILCTTKHPSEEVRLRMLRRVKMVRLVSFAIPICTILLVFF